MTRKWWLFPLFAWGLASLAPAMAQPAASPATPSTIRIGIPAQPGPDGKLVAGIDIKVVNGFLTQQLQGTGTQVEWKYVTGAGPGINEALANNSLDFALYGDFPAIIGRAAGLQTRLLLSAERGHNSYLVTPIGSSATSIKDLAGKRIGINRGRPWQLAFSRLLSSNGLKESDFQLFNLAPADGNAALAAGKVDAYYLNAAYPLVEKNVAKIIWSTKPQPLDWKFTAEVFGTQGFVDAHPDLTLKVVKAYVQAARHDGDPAHRDAHIQGTVTLGTSLDAQRRHYEGVDFRVTLSPLLDPFLRAHYEQAVAYAVENKLIRKPLPMDGWFDPSFVDRAVRELGLQDYWQPVGASGIVQAASDK